MSAIAQAPGLCGGEPTVGGMRITVRDIVEYTELYGSKERFLRALPDLTESDLDAALDYCRLHREEIDRYRAEEDEPEVAAPVR